MVSSSDHSSNRKMPRRWVLRSPRRKQEKGPNDSSSETGGAPSADDQRLVSASSASATASSGGGFRPLASPSRSSSSRSPLSRLRSKVTAPASRMIAKGFRRRSPDQRMAGGRTNKGQQRSPTEAGELHSNPDTASEDVNLVIRSDERAVEGALKTQEGGDSYNMFESNRCDQDRLLDVTSRPPAPAAAATHQTSRGHNNLSARGGVPVFSAVKAGKQPPQIAFIGVFLNGVAVVLASYVPFGGADARIALVKSLLVEHSSTPLRRGGCYTARGSELAVHLVVDQKQRVYACITAEDVPFSLGLSLLEEVQIEYISTVSTLAFSTKENSHTARCRPQMARSWAKYEGIERTLARERKTRRLLGEDPLDIETPLSRENKTHTGAEVTPLHFNAEHQPVLLLAAAREAFSLEEGREGGGKVAPAADSDDAADRDWPSADDDADGDASRVRLSGHRRKKGKAAAALFAGAATLLVLCAARRVILPSL